MWKRLESEKTLICVETYFQALSRQNVQISRCDNDSLTLQQVSLLAPRQCQSVPAMSQRIFTACREGNTAAVLSLLQQPGGDPNASQSGVYLLGVL